jgi:hypothetical protein
MIMAYENMSNTVVTSGGVNKNMRMKIWIVKQRRCVNAEDEDMDHETAALC